MNEKTKLTLDYSKWICGDESENKLGKGSIALLNTEGYMCCLGQWSCQLGVLPEKLLNRGQPNEIGQVVEGIVLLIKEEYVREPEIYYKNTNFSKAAMGINDDKETTPIEKIQLLSDLCNHHGFDLSVINVPPESTPSKA